MIRYLVFLVLLFEFSTASSREYFEVRDLDVVAIGNGLNGIGTDFVYLRISFKESGFFCSMYVPQNIVETESLGNDNPYIKAHCERDGVEYIEVSGSGTFVKFRKALWGGLGSDLELTVKLINPASRETTDIDIKARVEGLPHRLINDF